MSNGFIRDLKKPLVIILLGVLGMLFFGNQPNNFFLSAGVCILGLLLAGLEGYREIIVNKNPLFLKTAPDIHRIRVNYYKPDTSGRWIKVASVDELANSSIMYSSILKSTLPAPKSYTQTLKGNETNYLIVSNKAAVEIPVVFYVHRKEKKMVFPSLDWNRYEQLSDSAIAETRKTLENRMRLEHKVSIGQQITLSGGILMGAILISVIMLWFAYGQYQNIINKGFELANKNVDMAEAVNRLTKVVESLTTNSTEMPNPDKSQNTTTKPPLADITKGISQISNTIKGGG